MLRLLLPYLCHRPSMKIQLTLAIILFSSCAAFSQNRDELLRLQEEDQHIRKKFTGERMTDTSVIYEMLRFDSASTTRLKEMLGNSPWFSKDAIGSKGLAAAFILLQHSPDHDFQKRCLPYIEKQAREGDLPMQDYALLLDRTLVHDKKPQIFGTQIKEVNGEWLPYPIEDSANIDKRRAEIGLFSMEQYITLIKQFYKLNDKKK